MQALFKEVHQFTFLQKVTKTPSFVQIFCYSEFKLTIRTSQFEKQLAK